MTPDNRNLALTTMLATVLDLVPELSYAGNGPPKVVNDRVPFVLERDGLIEGLVDRCCARNWRLINIGAVFVLRMSRVGIHDGHCGAEA